MPTEPRHVPVSPQPDAGERRLHTHGINAMPAGYDAEVAELFRDLRAATTLSEADLAMRLGTRPEVVQSLEQGALYALPAWPETCRVVNGYGALLNLDVRPLLRRIYSQLEAGIVELQPKPIPEVPMMTPSDTRDFGFAAGHPAGGNNAGGAHAPNPLDIPWPPAPAPQTPPPQNVWQNAQGAPAQQAPRPRAPAPQQPNAWPQAQPQPQPQPQAWPAQQPMPQGARPAQQVGSVELVGGPLGWVPRVRSEPLVFVITGRNVPPGRMRRCLDSLVAQRGADWGAVIVDDGSDELSCRYLQFWAEAWRDRVTLIQPRERRGQLANTALAVRHICTDPDTVIVTLDLDDALIGADVADALERVGARMHSLNMEWASMAIRIQRQVGGNLAETLRTTAATLREREALRRQVRALSAEGRLSAYILIALPIFLFLYLLKVNYEYIRLLWTTPLGWFMSIGGLVFMAVGIVWMRRVVKVEV